MQNSNISGCISVDELKQREAGTDKPILNKLQKQDRREKIADTFFFSLSCMVDLNNPHLYYSLQTMCLWQKGQAHLKRIKSHFI